MTVETDFDVYTITDPKVLLIEFKSQVEFNVRLLITLKTANSNVVFPKIIKLGIYGCGEPVLPVTKGVIEISKKQRPAYIS